jgi:hypothetical protein
MTKKIPILTAIGILAGISAIPLSSYAATELLVTWKASSYIPSNYKGKALPTGGTPIRARAILIENGKSISLAPYEISWYAGEERIAGGLGVNTASFRTPKTGQDSLELRVNVARYKDRPLDAFVTIPIVQPVLALKKKKTSSKVDFSAIPYFWNIKTPEDLAITWTENSDIITARAVNKENPLEFARAEAEKK